MMNGDEVEANMTGSNDTQPNDAQPGKWPGAQPDGQPDECPDGQPGAQPDEFLAASAARRIELIRARLETALAPVVSVDVRDDSAQHAGHMGHAGRAAAGGTSGGTPDATGASGSHYHVTVIARAFSGQSRLARHRLVYDALATAMQHGIHALAITALAPEEAARDRNAPSGT